MKEEKIRRNDEESTLDILLGVRVFKKQPRPVGRLGQLNKHAKRLRRYYGQVSETCVDSLS